jgi:hypothetical protein
MGHCRYASTIGDFAQFGVGSGQFTSGGRTHGETQGQCRHSALEKKILACAGIRAPAVQSIAGVDNNCLQVPTYQTSIKMI